jgi:hypothetical protein
MRRRGRLMARSSPVAARREHRWSGGALLGEPGCAGSSTAVAAPAVAGQARDAAGSTDPGRAARDEQRRRALRGARARRLALALRASAGAR